MKKIITLLLVLTCMLSFSRVKADDGYTLTVILESKEGDCTFTRSGFNSNNEIFKSVTDIIHEELGDGLKLNNGSYVYKDKYSLSYQYTPISYKNYKTNEEIMHASSDFLHEANVSKKITSDLTVYAHLDEIIYNIALTAVPPSAGTKTYGMDTTETISGYTYINKPQLLTGNKMAMFDYEWTNSWHDKTRVLDDEFDNWRKTGSGLPYDNNFNIFTGTFEDGKTYYAEVWVVPNVGYAFEHYVGNCYAREHSTNVTINGARVTYWATGYNDIRLCYEIEAQKHLIWENVDNSSYWYEYGKKQGVMGDSKNIKDVNHGNIERGREIFDPVSNGWYWLDANADGAKAENKEVWMPYIYQDEDTFNEEQLNQVANDSNTYTETSTTANMGEQVKKAIQNKEGKWVRYDENGKMYKGWVTLKDWQEKPEQNGNTYYYDYKTGLMAKGETIIDGKTYFFDEVTGVLRGNR